MGRLVSALSRLLEHDMHSLVGVHAEPQGFSEPVISEQPARLDKWLARA